MDYFRRQNWDIVGKAWLWFLISALITGSGLVVWLTKGLNYGIDFTGGTLVRYSLAKPVATSPAEEAQVVAKIREALASLGLQKSQIQIADGRVIIIRTYAVANDEEAAQRDAAILQAIEQLFGAQFGPVEHLGRETVGPVVGAELRAAALKALILGQLLILVYITVRYEFRFAAAGIIGLLHDVLLLTGAMAIFRVELNSWFVAAILTVIGYSINDSVIIFDRIRENRGRHRHSPLAPIVNASLLETMTRSINTTLTTLFTLIALFLLGGPVIQGFALAMLIGITTGAYSSIFLAAPIVAIWDQWSRARAGLPARTTRPALATAGSANATLSEGETEETAAPTPRPSAVETMRRAAERAQEEKRALRRERRQKKREKKKKGGGK
ncbi:MAG: protein translocase subunit SecF [Armatimonadetes bacterium]|nr:protein translocase subunit SecF [Armatimonadota bacterium]